MMAHDHHDPATREHRPGGWNRVVVKLGSHAVVDADGRIDEGRCRAYVDQMIKLHRSGVDVICVSSGAVAAGLSDLGLAQRPTDLPSLQAAAAIGQARLVERYRQYFQAADIRVAQVLLIHDDLRHRERHLNARYTLERLLQARIVPIINENDTVSVAEMRFGDNDALSALVAMLLHADALVMLTNTDGILDFTTAVDGERVPFAVGVSNAIRELVQPGQSSFGRGGMMSKLDAADMVTSCGACCHIAHAEMPDVLTRLWEGESVGTTFAPAERRLSPRKRWIAFFDHPQGTVRLDDGAVEAVRDRGRSLLAVGVVAVDGTFDRGAPVRLVDSSGREIGRGLTSFDADDLRAIAGQASEAIDRILGRCEYAEVIHRDNLALTASADEPRD
ncbi:MAG: glutamate 5-kinase [Planctomycetota bacterium]